VGVPQISVHLLTHPSGSPTGGPAKVGGPPAKPPPAEPKKPTGVEAELMSFAAQPTGHRPSTGQPASLVCGPHSHVIETKMQAGWRIEENDYPILE